MWGIDMLFVVGGNGGNAGAAAIQAQCEKDAVVCNVVGVPKSIDNDILVVSTTSLTIPCYQSSCATRPAQFSRACAHLMHWYINVPSCTGTFCLVGRT